MINQSVGIQKTWEDGGLRFTEAICQEYANCKFSAGFVYGHPIDTIYFQAEKDGVVTTQLLLRPDEAAIISWVMSGVLWSDLIEKNREKEWLKFQSH